MNNNLRIAAAAVAGALAVSLIMPAIPARTQDRGTSVIVANTPADPVPAYIVNPDPISTRLTNDPGAPLFIAPSEQATFNVCPVSCGAYQVDASDLGAVAATVELAVPTGVRFTIRYLSVEASREGAGGLRVRVRPSFSGSSGPDSQSIFVPIEFQGVSFSGRRFFHGSFPVHVYHDSVAGGTALTALAESAAGADVQVRLRVLASGNLEPLPQP